MARPWLMAAPDLEISFKEVFGALFAKANLQPGEKVLDVGCGTGPTLLTAAAAVGGEGRILGVDIAPPLVVRASERVPANVRLAIGDAGTYEFETGAFDAIIANFGIMFFQDNVAAFRNLRRAVPLGGRLAATFWASPPQNPWFSIPRKIVDAHVNDVPRPAPTGPGPMRFGDPAALVGYMKEAGWTPEIETLDLTLLPPGEAARVADFQMLVTVGMMLKGIEVSEEVLDLIKADLTQAFAGYRRDGAIRVPARIHIVSATAV